VAWTRAGRCRSRIRWARWDKQGGMASSRCGLHFHWRASFCLFEGGPFSIFGGFLPILADFVNFGDLIFPFSLFSDFLMRYTRAANPTLYFSSAEMSFKV
jgi:hypothetical protein